jgi:hypothetical protein
VIKRLCFEVRQAFSSLLPLALLASLAVRNSIDWISGRTIGAIRLARPQLKIGLVMVVVVAIAIRLVIGVVEGRSRSERRRGRSNLVAFSGVPMFNKHTRMENRIVGRRSMAGRTAV